MQALKFKTSVLFFMLVGYPVDAQIERPTLMPGLAIAYASNLDVSGINARLYYAAVQQYVISVLDYLFCYRSTN